MAADTVWTCNAHSALGTLLLHPAGPLVSHGSRPWQPEAGHIPVWQCRLTLLCDWCDLVEVVILQSGNTG